MRIEVGVAALWKKYLDKGRAVVDRNDPPLFFSRKNKTLSHIRRPSFNGPLKIHTASKPNKLVVKQIRLDEPYASMVSDHSSDH